MMIRKIYLLVLVSNICTILAQNDVIVTIRQGKLKGVSRINRKSEPFFAFRSIPFAKPPVGKLRFQTPVPHDGWQGIRDASPDVPGCYQAVDNDNNAGQEDCLYLNVFTKCLNSTTKCPVMVFFHGGSFLSGSPREEIFNPEFLLTKDIVLVVPSYRLGILGLLSFNATEGNPISDNAAMRDQVLALKWIKQNIAAFGGDPKQVTIFGESAGAISVHYHMFSPLSTGLFHKVIAQSGLAAITSGITFRGTAELAAKELQINYEGPKDLLQKLQQASAADLINAQKKFFNIEFNRPIYNFPVVEGDVSDAFLPIAPEILLKKKKYNRVPMIIGYTDKEGMVLEMANRLTGQYVHLYNTSNVIPSNLYLQSQKARDDVAKEIQNFYYNGQNGNPQTDFNAFIDLITDLTVLHAQYETIPKHVSNKDTVYFYRFAGNTTLNIIKRMLPSFASLIGAAHGDDIGYLFKTIFTPEVIPNSIEDEMIDLMVGMWHNFAKYSNPTPTGTPFKWLPVSKGAGLNYLDIRNNVKPHIGINPDYERAMFWKYIYDTYSYH